MTTTTHSDRTVCEQRGPGTPVIRECPRNRGMVGLPCVLFNHPRRAS